MVRVVSVCKQATGCHLLYRIEASQIEGVILIKSTEGNWAGWPTCPQCHTRREARCSVCMARGTDFRLADFEEPDDPEEIGGADVLLLCSTCDEPFTPDFYRCCAECGFDFGEGLEQSETAHEALNHRAALVLAGVALLLVGLLAFFAIVLRG